MRKVLENYYSEEKGMTIIVNTLNWSLLWDIYNRAYIVSTINGFPPFHIIEYQQSGKNLFLFKPIKFIIRTIFVHS